jgi:hypothetical protein
VVEANAYLRRHLNNATTLALAFVHRSQLLLVFAPQPNIVFID